MDFSFIVHLSFIRLFLVVSKYIQNFCSVFMCLPFLVTTMSIISWHVPYRRDAEKIEWEKGVNLSNTKVYCNFISLTVCTEHAASVYSVYNNEG
jgi:hypothetical protein